MTTTIGSIRRTGGGGELTGLLMALAIIALPGSTPAQTVLVSEGFENGSFGGRGWYDSTGGTLSSVEHLPGSAASYECRFAAGATGCSGGSPGRHLFTATESVYLSLHVKHSSSWAGSGLAYHPHMFHFVTDQNDAYVGPAYTHLTAYIEENQGYPQLAIQDGQNIDESKVGQNLIGVTESRSVAGCNGVATNIGSDSVSCYLASGSTHWNGVTWKGPSPTFFSSSKTSWHHVEAHFKLNSVSNGVGQPDGTVQYWYDGQLVIDHKNVILRTGKYASMKFNQFLLAPYIGDGSPVDQTIWIDDLTIATGRPATTSPDGALPIKDAGPLPHDAAPVKKDSEPLPRDGAPVKKDSTSPTEGGPPGRDSLAGGDGASRSSDTTAPLRPDAAGAANAGRLSSGCRLSSGSSELNGCVLVLLWLLALRARVPRRHTALR